MTCESTVGDENCSCSFENPLLTESGWYKMCKTKIPLKLGKKKVRKRQLSAVCREACEHGGYCTAEDFCTCPNEYRGSTCQYPITLCSISKNLQASSWHCNHTRSETLCDVSCYPPDTPEAEVLAERYVCKVEGEWTPLLPPCVQVLQCTKPQSIQNGGWRLLIGKTMSVGSRVGYFCADGFQLLGSDFATCLPNATWSHQPPRCERRQDISCTDPGDIPFGRRGNNQQTFLAGSSVSYTCTERFSLVGNPVITCQQDGRWSSAKPQCVSDSGFTFTALCPKPNVPKNALVFVSYPSQHPLRTFFSTDISLTEKLYLLHSARQYQESNETFPVGTRVQYRCKSRFYKLYGSEYQTCLSSRTWSGYQPACIPDCGRSDAPRTPFIVNGNASQMGHWPWQVGLTLKGPTGPQLICGAVLISELWALTAAHCVTRKFSNVAMEPRELLLFCGKFYRSFAKDDEYVQVRQVKQIVINEEYDFIHFDGDIALLQLETPVELTTRIQPVCLPTEETTRENIRDGKKGIVLGWGLTENGTFSESLRETTLPIVGHDRCEEAYREGLRSITITRNMFCAGHETGLSDTCNGDSGGPFVFSVGPANDHRWYLEGLVSWGSESGCGKAKHYSGFTKVGRYVPWINMFI
ncbi:clotting factor C-like [Uloborus diversus]|uniref:clotting factor C-like n=1 Tax=Uloborus diversus TaxID=327109 RepID=UPI00240A4568|nr:clotting factor C-like [Uloborus diversus]